MTPDENDKAPTVTITASQFWDAYADALKRHDGAGGAYLDKLIKNIAQRLGLEKE